ncbi:MAG: hypothetical protein WD638_10675 [Nitriliruptoraceae bacterium]
MSTQRYPFDFDPRFRALLAALGIREINSEVLLEEDRFLARFGRWEAHTSIANIRDVCITRGYRWYRAIGPRGSAADRGASFGTNTRAGVCVRFHTPIPALFGQRILHPGLTVTVADPEGLATEIDRRIADRRPT